MQSRAIAVFLLALALAACASPAILGRSAGSVSGHVMVRTCGGANRESQTGCPIQPLAGVTLSFQEKNASSADTATTDSRGEYRIDLPPGTYMVSLSNVAVHSSASGPPSVSVTAGKTVTADFTYTIQLL